MPLVQDKPPLENASLSDASSVERTQPGFPATGSPVWDRAWDRSVQATAHRGTVQGAHRGMSHPAPQAAARPVELNLSSLQNVGSRDELVQAACEAGLVYARGVGFVTLRKGVFRGWGGAGEHLTEAGIRSLWVPATNPSALNEVAHSGVGSRGFYGQTAADQLLRTALGGEGREVLIAPVRVGDRILGLLCADDPGPDAESLDEIAKAMGYGFERLIVARKLDR